MLSMLVAGCGGKDASSQSGKSGEKVTITFWDVNAGPDRTPYYEEVIKRFETANPNIHVEYVGLPKSAALQKINAAVSANDCPDVSGVGTGWMADLTARGALLALDPYFEKWNEKDKINKAVLDTNRRVAGDGKLYQMPNTMNMECMWYRADWFKEAGLKAPETWDDFFAAVQKMTDKSKNRYGYSIRGGNGGSFQLERDIMAFNGDPTYIDANGKCTINSPKNVEFVKKYLGLYQEYTPKSDVTNGYKEMVAGFDTGAVAMIQHNIGSYSEHSKALKADQYMALAMPKAANGKYLQVAGNTDGYGVYKSTKHPEEAWKFVAFMCSKEIQSYWNEKIGQLPTNVAVFDDQWTKDLPHTKMAAALLKDPNLIFYDNPSFLPDYRAILDQVVDPGVQSVLTGKTTVEEFLNEWAAAIEKSNAKFKAAHQKK